jgi:pyruvate/2-oxoglutarate/acetoin dehydrogenase E1 component
MTLSHAQIGQTAQATRRLTQTEAIVEAIAQEMRRDPRVSFIGQDVGEFGGSMQGAKGLWEEFGARRIREAPISESAMVGAAIGSAMFGRRPIVEVSFGEFLPAAMNQLINQAPNLHYMTGGAASVPVVIRTRVGDGPYGGHPQDYSVWFAYVPGLKVVMPGTPADAKGLMLAAIRDENPVLFVEPMSLAHGPREDVPDGDHLVPIGKARIAREGTDLTIVTIGSMVPVALRAAALLAADGIDAEVVDLRTLAPLDADTIVASVRKTGGLVTVHESWVSFGIGAEVAAIVAERALEDLLAPVKRVGTRPIPVPSGALRKHALPTADDVVAACRELLAGSAK